MADCCGRAGCAGVEMLPGKDGLTASGVGRLSPWVLLPPAPSQLGPFPWQKPCPILNLKLEGGRLGFA